MPIVRCVVALFLLASAVDAQVLEVPRARQRTIWVSGSVGFSQWETIVDGTTSTAWDFGTAAQYRASAEVEIGNQSSVGLTGSHARMPLTYTALSPAPGGPACTPCDAHADVQSLFLSFHAGGAEGFHYIVDIGVGVVRYGSFRDDASDAKLRPSKGDIDFAFGIGTGFGYGFGRRVQLMLVQDYGTSLHQRENLPGNSRTNAQHYVTRIGLRYGLGR